jgi:hypothetical protein
MDKDAVRQLVIAGVTRIQEKSGREMRRLTDRTRPIGDLPGFTSLNGLELNIILSKELPLGPGFNPCISDDGTRALPMAEMVDRILLNITNDGR